MGRLFESKIYKKSFIIYSLILLAVFAVIFVLTQKSMMDSSLLHFEYKASRCFEESERRAERVMGDIDNCLLDLYSDDALLEDFIFFWNNDVSDYVSKSLDFYKETGKYSSFTDKVAALLSEDGYAVKTVYFVTSNGIRRMKLDSNGNIDFDYDVSPDEYFELIRNSNDSVIYFKNVKNPDNMANVMGSIAFEFDSTYLTVLSDSDFESVCTIRNSFAGENRKRNGFRWLKPIYTFSYYSNRLNYGLKMEISREKVIGEQLASVIIVGLSMAIAYVLVVLLIAGHMRKESLFLSEVLGAIQSGHNGNFKKINIGTRKDEYAIIASEINTMADELDEYIHREYVLTIQQQETKMQALLYQINPHFLYNTLEIIRTGAIKNNDEETADEIVALAKLFRMMVKEENIISLRKEIELLKSYLKLMEYRFRDTFSYQIDIEESVLDLDTVKFWMQPIAENFFVHGFDDESEFNLLIVQGYAEEDYFRIKIIDNGKGVTDEKLTEINQKLESQNGTNEGKEVGICNVAMRLKSYYADRCRVYLSKGDIRGLTVNIDIRKA